MVHWYWIPIVLGLGWFIGVTRETAQRAYMAGLQHGRERVERELADLTEDGIA